MHDDKSNDDDDADALPRYRREGSGTSSNSSRRANDGVSRGLAGTTHRIATVSGSSPTGLLFVLPPRATDLVLSRPVFLQLPTLEEEKSLRVIRASPL